MLKTRYELYEFAYKYLEKENFENQKQIANHFYISSILVKNLENTFERTKDFIDILKYNSKQLENVEHDLTEKYIILSENVSKDKKKNYKSLLNKLFRGIANIQNKLFGIKFIKNVRNINIIYDKQIFLSYAYYDKGLSYALYLYFRANNSFLFIDWMWNSKETNAGVLKKKLMDDLKASRQMLLLRSPASEYSIRGNNQIRQWCSWECGIGYSMYPNEKYVINLNPWNMNRNIFVEDFKIMKGIDGRTGLIK